MGEYQVAIGQTHIHVRYFLIKDGISVGDLKVKYCPTEKMFADHFTKPLQGVAFRKFRTEIQRTPEDTIDTDLGWDRPKEKFIPIPHDCVEKIEVNTDMRTNESRVGSRMERSKSWESNTVVHTVEVITVGHSKSQESIPVVGTVSYAKILRINILLVIP